MQTVETPQLKPTRSSFIRGLPESMSIDEVIERGREIGLAINPSDVHSTRYYMREEAARMGSKPAPAIAASAPEQVSDVAAAVRRNYSLLEHQRAAAPGAETADRASGRTQRKRETPPARGAAARRSTPTPTVAATQSLEGELRKIVLRVGTERTREIIDELERLSIR